MKFIVWSFLLSTLVYAEAPTPSSVLANRSGISELKKNNPAAAQNQFIQGLSQTPFEAKLHLNLGLTFELLSQFDRAQSSYETALKYAQDDQLRFVAYFNLGEMKQKEKKKEEALKFYQQALKFNPESIETKVNIELLTQQNQGGGQDQNKDSKSDPNGDSQKDKDDQNKEGQNKEDQNKEDKNEEGDKKPKNKSYSKGKPPPPKFKSEDLNQADVNKILGEINRQEQKIRSDFNKRDIKEKANEKDW